MTRNLRVLAIFLAPAVCFGQAVISLSVASGPPTSSVQVSGSGFAPYAEVDVYFDTQDEGLAQADGLGSFTRIAIEAPASALPGDHWVSAVARAGQVGAQVQFKVQTDWNQFHRRNMKRYNPYENVLSVDTVGGLQLKWKYRIGWTDFASPAVAHGMVYDTSTGYLWALNAATGARMWTFSKNGSIFLGSPAVWNGAVYAGDDAHIYARNASTGAVLWTFLAGAEVVSSPTVANGVVYAGSNDGNGGGYLYALNASTGAMLWRYPVVVWESSPAVANGVVYIGADATYAVNASTGTLVWRYDTGGVASPAVANGVVYIGSSDAGRLYAINASTGGLLWSYQTGAEVMSSPAVADGVVYFGSLDGYVYALNASTGAKLWSYPSSANTGVGSSPAVANSVVYAGSGYDVIGLNARTGAKLWSYTTGDYIYSSPAVVNGAVYIGSRDSHLYCFGLKKNANEVETGSEPPELQTLRPDFSLKVSQPALNLEDL